MMSFGVPAGASTPCMVSDSWPSTPASAMVGTSGSAGERLVEVTASPRRLPPVTCGAVGGKAVNCDGRLSGDGGLDRRPARR